MSDSEQFKEIARLLRTSEAIEYKKSVANFELGRHLDALYASEGEGAVAKVVEVLKEKGLQVKQEFLFDSMRVFRSIRSVHTLDTIRGNLRGRLPWGFLVSNCRIPHGDDEIARAYWEKQLSLIENSFTKVGEAAERVSEHLEDIPEAVRPEAEGVLSVLAHQAAGKQQERSYGPVRKILHTGDEHFELDETLPDIIKGGLHIIEKARQERPDLIVSSGDLLNSRQTHDSPALNAARGFVKALAEIAPVFILKGTTTHDGVSVALFQDLDTKHSVYVAETLEMVGLKNGVFSLLTEYQAGLDALIYAIPPANKATIIANGGGMQESNTTVAEMLRTVFNVWGAFSEMARKDGVMTVVSGHGTVTGAQASTGQKMVGRDIEFSLGDLMSIGTDVVCLSHIHKAQAWKEERIFYSGSTAKLNVGEREDKGFWLHTKTPEGLQSEFAVIPTKQIVSTEFDGLPDLGALPEIEKGSLVRIVYKVAEEEVHSVNEAALKEQLLAMGAGEVRIEKSIIPKQMVRAAGISKIASLVGKLKKWGETTSTAIDESLEAKLELLQLPRDVLFMELGLTMPHRRSKK